MARKDSFEKQLHPLGTAVAVEDAAGVVVCGSAMAMRIGLRVLFVRHQQLHYPERNLLKPAR